MSSIPFVTARPTARGRQATAADFGGGIGQATAALGQGIGVLGDATAQILKVKADQQDSKAMADATNEIATLDEEFLNDDEPETADARYGERIKEIESNFEKNSSGGIPLFGNAAMGRLKQITFSAVQKQRETTRMRGIAVARSDGRQAVEVFTRAAAQADTEFNRELFRDHAIDVIDRAEVGGLETPENARLARMEVDLGITNGVLNKLEREDPALALEELNDKASPFVRGMTEAQIQVRKTSATNAIEANEKQETNREDRALKIVERERKAASIEIQNDWIEQSAEGEPPSLEEVIRGIQTGNLEPRIAEKWVKVTTDGFNPATTDTREVYGDLFLRSSNGEPIREAAASAYLDGDLTKSSHDQLIKSSENKRFGEARAKLVTSLLVGTQSNDKGGRSKAAQAASDFDDWAFRNQDATRDQANARADSLILGARNMPIDKIPAFNVKPALAVMEGNKLLIPQTAARILRALELGKEKGGLERGGIDAAEAAAETRVMDRFDRAQRAAEQIQKAREAEDAAKAAARANK